MKLLVFVLAIWTTSIMAMEKADPFNRETLLDLCRGRMVLYGLNVTNSGKIKMSPKEETYRRQTVELALWFYTVLYHKGRFPQITPTDKVIAEDENGKKYYKLVPESERIDDLKSWMSVCPNPNINVSTLLPAFDMDIWKALKDFYKAKEIVTGCSTAVTIYTVLHFACFEDPQNVQNITSKTYLNECFTKKYKNKDAHLEKIYFHEMNSLYEQNEGEYRVVLPGDQYTFPNLDDYLHWHPFSNEQAENTIYVGFDRYGKERFMGFKYDKPRTAEDIHNSLADAYIHEPTELEKERQKIGTVPFFKGIFFKDPQNVGLSKSDILNKIKKQESFCVSLKVPFQYNYDAEGKLMSVVVESFSFDGYEL